MKRVLSVASHPISTGVIGFVIGAIAAFSVPSLAEFASMPEGDRMPEQGKLIMEPPRGGQRGMGRPEGRPEGRPGQTMPPGGPNDRPNGDPNGMPNFFGLPKGAPTDSPMNNPMGGQGNEGKMMPEFNSDAMGQPGEGMSAEEDEQRQAAQEARQKEQQKRMLEQMKRGMQQASKNLESMKKMFDKWKSKGIALPAECGEAYTESKTLIDAVAKAESAEQVEDLSPEDLQDQMQTLQECRQMGERLARLPQLLKRVDSEIKSLEKMWVRAKKGASEAMQDTVKEGDASLEAIKQARTKVTETIKSGEIDDIEALIEDDIYGKLDDVRSEIQRLEAARNAKKYMLEYVKQMRTARSYVDRLRKLGKDVQELEATLTQAQQKYDQIKGLKPGSEEYQDAVQELADIGREFADQTTSDQDVGAQLDGQGEKK